MAILSGPEILRQIGKGRIVIEPFDPRPTKLGGQIGPNSVDLKIGDTLKMYDLAETGYLDSHKNNPTFEVPIPESGYVLRPGEFYLATTVEWTETWDHVPYIDGRSSTGRLSVSVHETAGRGDLGFCGRWTLEITVVLPVKIYPGDRVCQITYHTIEGEPLLYDGRYQHQHDVTASRFHQE